MNQKKEFTKLKKKGYADYRGLIACGKTKVPKYTNDLDERFASFGIFSAIFALFYILFTSFLKSARGNLKLPRKICIALNKNTLYILKASPRYKSKKVVKKIRFKTFGIESSDEYVNMIYVLKAVTVEGEVFTFSISAPRRYKKLLIDFLEGAQGHKKEEECY